MQLERTPVLGITVAVLVLCLECVGLVAYEQAHEQLTAAIPPEPQLPAIEEVPAPQSHLLSHQLYLDYQLDDSLILRRRDVVCQFRRDL